MEDPIETLKQTYNIAWTTGFLKQNKNTEFKPSLQSKKIQPYTFPCQSEDPVQNSPNKHFTPYVNLGSIC